MSKWKELYRAVTVEKNLGFLAHLIDKTEYAMWLRLRQLRESSEDQAERHEIETACDRLLGLKTDKLGWPYSLR
jgi:hypothetical protein